MMRSNRPLAAQRLANRTPHALQTNATFGVRLECTRRAICEPLWRQTVVSTASLRTLSKPPHNDAVEST
eukprot:11160164-Lingulodinium_polyedra.AAC.1